MVRSNSRRSAHENCLGPVAQVKRAYACRRECSGPDNYEQAAGSIDCRASFDDWEQKRSEALKVSTLIMAQIDHQTAGTRIVEQLAECGSALAELGFWWVAVERKIKCLGAGQKLSPPGLAEISEVQRRRLCAGHAPGRKISDGHRRERHGYPLAPRVFQRERCSLAIRDDPQTVQDFRRCELHGCGFAGASRRLVARNELSCPFDQVSQGNVPDGDHARAQRRVVWRGCGNDAQFIAEPV